MRRRRCAVTSPRNSGEVGVHNDERLDELPGVDVAVASRDECGHVDITPGLRRRNRTH
jgi:hypothetical protein